MCLNIQINKKKFQGLNPVDSKKDLKKIASMLLKKAEKSITIFKVLQIENGKAYSPFQGKRTKFDVMLSSKFSFASYYYEGFSVQKGLHCFTKKRYAREFHQKVWGFAQECKIFRGYIPEGAEYYVSTDGTQMASNYMVVEEKSYSL